MPRRALRGRLPDNVRPEAGELVLARLAEEGAVEIEGDLVRRPGFAPTLDAETKTAIERILAWDFDRVVLSHGEVLETGGRDALRDSYRWLLGS